MKIAINCSYFTPRGGGIKEYIYNLVKNIDQIDKKNEYVFYIFKDQESFWLDNFGQSLNYKIIPFKKKQRILTAMFSYHFWKKELKIEKFDIFHSPFFHIPSGITCKTVITVHDLRFERFPKSYQKLRLLYLKYKVPRSLKKADHIISISDFTKNEIIKFYRLPKNKITTIHEAIDLKRFNPKNILQSEENEILKKMNLTKNNFFLSVGHIEPRKNYERLIKAFIEFKKLKKNNYKLVIVGKKNLNYKNVIKLIEENNLNILYNNYVSEKELITLYKNAYIFVFPSYYEGFGFPPLEAATLGTPSIASNLSSIPEIAGKGALYFDPFNIEDIKNKMYKVTTNIDIYNNLKKYSKENLKRFSWKKNITETIKIYDKILKKKKFSK